MADRLPKLPTCQNCGATTGSNFCPDCGQDCRDHTVSLKLLFHDFIDDVFTFDSRFFRSFVPLLVKPGNLTIEYTRGRRIRYIPPLRLYIFASLLFFFIVSIQVQQEIADFASSDDTVMSAEDSTAVAAAYENLKDLDVPGGQDAVDEAIRNLEAKLDTMTVGETDEDDGDGYFRVSGFDGESKDVDPKLFVTNLMKLVPKAMFLLLPLFAAVLATIYWRARRKFIEHLVFSLHYHSFMFLLFALAMVVDNDALHLVVFFGMQVYLYFALKRIYSQGWWKTGLKFFLLTGAYNTILFTLLILVAVSTAQLMEWKESHPLLVQWILY